MAEVIYKCKCLKEEVTILVPDRLPGSDIADWMENAVMNCIAVDHRARSSHCHLSVMEYAKMPADNPEGIGVPFTKQ